MLVLQLRDRAMLALRHGGMLPLLRRAMLALQHEAMLALQFRGFVDSRNSQFSFIAIPGTMYLTATSQTCIQLALTLPYQKYDYNVYFDKYFTNISLFATSRDYGIGAYGTARKHMILEELWVDDCSARKELEWNDLFGVEKDGALCGLWQYSAQVLVMSTIYDLQTGTTRLRSHPKETGLNTKISRAAFDGEVNTSLNP